MTDAIPTQGGFLGFEWLLDGASDFSALMFAIDQAISERAFCGLVKVLSVIGGTASGSPPMVSVRPMVDQFDPSGNRYPHGTIYNIPVFRLQGGNTALVLDPVVGDIGGAIICHRDISTVKATGQISGPGSRRQNSWADGLYLGGWLNGAPTTYISASDAGGIRCVTPAATLIIAAGTIATTGVFLNNGTHVGSTHTHPVTTAPGTTGAPNP